MEKKKVKVKSNENSPLEEVRKKKPLLRRGWGGSSPSSGGVGEAPKILVIQQKMIGDVLVSSLICENLKLNYPKAEVHYLVNRFTIPVIENNPFIDKIVVFEDEYRSSKVEFYRFLKSIRRSNYDAVIDAYGKLESNLVTLFSGAETKISWEKSYTKFIYTDVFRKLNSAETEAGLAVEDRLNLLSPFNLDSSLKIHPKIYLTEDEKEKALSKLKNSNISFVQSLYMIGVLGSDSSKSYPKRYMAEVLDYIVKRTNAQLIFNYAPHQKSQAAEIFEKCKPTTQDNIRLNLSPKSLREFMALTYHCDALIGNEGGAVNMAKALGVSTFTIFSPWIDKKAWGSFEDTDSHKSIHLEEIKPEFYKSTNYKELKGKSKELYEELSSDFVIDKLKLFLQKILG